MRRFVETRVLAAESIFGLYAPPEDALDFRLHHIGVIVPFVEQAERFIEFFGLSELWRGDAPKYEALCIFVRFAGVRVEFIVPRGEKLKKFNRGHGGIHHLAIESDRPVDEIAAELVRTKGAQLLEETAVAGASLLVNFIQPISTGGVLIELVEAVDKTRFLDPVTR